MQHLALISLKKIGLIPLGFFPLKYFLIRKDILTLKEFCISPGYIFFYFCRKMQLRWCDYYIYDY